MKSFVNKPLTKGSVSHKTSDANNVSYGPRAKIKLKEVTAMERQRLRISSYQYLLP